MEASLQLLVRTRATYRCEYCRIHQDQNTFYTFPIDHIVAEQHGGRTYAGNLALSCLRCNLHKGPNIAGIDPLTKRLSRLYDPRKHKWNFHFRLEGARIVGLTSIGRTTAYVLAMNHPEAIALREALLDER